MSPCKKSYKLCDFLLTNVVSSVQYRKDKANNFSLGCLYGFSPGGVNNRNHIMITTNKRRTQQNRRENGLQQTSAELSQARNKSRLQHNFNILCLFSKMVTHLLRTHLFMEPIAVASYRQLPTLHPLFKLLSPHIRGVLAINTLGRDVLIAEGGVADNTLTVGGGGNIFKKIFRDSRPTCYIESSFS